jgi:hypothetical protein
MTFMGIPESIAIGGTSMIIMVSVAIETWEQIKARALASEDKQTSTPNKKTKFRSFGEVKQTTKQEKKDGDLIF